MLFYYSSGKEWLVVFAETRFHKPQVAVSKGYCFLDLFRLLCFQKFFSGFDCFMAVLNESMYSMRVSIGNWAFRIRLMKSIRLMFWSLYSWMLFLSRLIGGWLKGWEK